MSLLFQPLTIKSITLKNRLVVSPMCQYSSHDGYANDWHLVHLGSRAVGGAGLVFTEAAAITPEGRISPGDLGIWDDRQMDMLKRIADFIGDQQSVPAIQLAHAGRKASHHAPFKGGKALTKEEGAWQTIAPSAIAFKDGDPVPREMTESDIEQCIQAFKIAAKRALQCGFKILEIHGAHGYLVNEFLSPFSNQRTDHYGGSFENRIRFLLQICDAVKEVWPDELPLFVRLSATEWVEGGWDGDDTVRLAKILKTHHVDLIDCSTGGNIPGVTIPLIPGYQVEFAERVKKESGLLSGAVGLITTAHQAENILQEERADLIFMAREFLRNPYFPLHAAGILNEEINWPPQYERARKKK